MSEKCFLCVCCGKRGPSRQIIEFGVDRLCHDALWWKTFFATLAEAIITARFPSRSRIR